MKLKLLIFLFILFPDYAFSRAECDSWQHYTFGALQFSELEADHKRVQYVEITDKFLVNNMADGFTLEGYLKPQKQNSYIVDGKTINIDTVYVGGQWGPFTDKDDSWVIYLNEDDLVFEVSSPDTTLDKIDNTVTKADISALWDTWFHFAVTFNPLNQTISIFIDGKLISSARNDNYPCKRLKIPETKTSTFLAYVASYSNPEKNKATYIGMMDEFRIWNFPLSEEEINCKRLNWERGDNDENLIALWRFNNRPNFNQPWELCDAADNGFGGKLVNGPAWVNWNRTEDITITTQTDVSFPDTIKCKNTKTYTWTLTQNEECRESDGARVYFQYPNPDKPGWINNPPEVTYSNENGSLNNWQWTQLKLNEPVTISATIDADFVGTRQYRIYVQSSNPANYRQIYYTNNQTTITRITDFKELDDTIRCGELLAFCEDEPFKDVTFKIANNTIGTQRYSSLKIDRIENNLGQIFKIISPVVSPSSPQIVAMGDTTEIVIRFYSKDTTAEYEDVLSIYTDDDCLPIHQIPITGKVNETLKILNVGADEIEQIVFSKYCLGERHTRNYYWENFTGQNITVDSIVFPPQFAGSGANGTVLEPETSYGQRVVSFTPTKSGNFSEIVYFYATANTETGQKCNIKIPLPVSGGGKNPQMQFATNSVNFGKVFVGQKTSLEVEIESIGDDPVNVDVFLRDGEQFFFQNMNSNLGSISPGASKKITIEFEPLDDSTYTDVICISDRSCNSSYCIEVTGIGTFDAFSYDPIEARIENVIACGFAYDTVRIVNELSDMVSLDNFNLLDKSGKFRPFNPPSLNGLKVDILSGQRKEFVFVYTPDDTKEDRADKAWLEYKALGNTWTAKLLATSAVPNIAMTLESEFGTLEVGEIKFDTITVENTSSLEIQIDSLQLKYNPDEVFELIEPKGQIDSIIPAGGTMKAILKFSPKEPISYEAEILGRITSPCEIIEDDAVGTKITGFGRLIPLNITTTILPFGQVKPCDCQMRKIDVMNRSRVNQMSIDSIWIDNSFESSTITFGSPDNFVWDSFFFDGELPFTIAPDTQDTLKISYCPRAPWLRDSLVQEGIIHIAASGPGWETMDEVYLDGRQMLIIENSPDSLSFAPTGINVFAIDTVSATFTIPDISINQDFADLLIDTVTFFPNERVFYFVDTLGLEFPITVKNTDFLLSLIAFRPRAPRLYEAKVYIHLREPCPAIDSTLKVVGLGQAQPFGLAIEYEDFDEEAETDTVSIPDCNELLLPIYTSRKIPADIIDIEMTFYYDTLNFDFIGIESVYLDTNCLGYSPTFSSWTDTLGGTRVKVKNFCGVDSLRPMYIAKFMPSGLRSGSQSFSVDSVDFNTEELLLYDISAVSDLTFARVYDADFAIIEDIVDFDSVRVLECVSRTFTIENTGEWDISLSEVVQEHPDIEIISITPDTMTVMQPGDITRVELKYCPSNFYEFDSLAWSETILPCVMRDEINLTGISYAPKFETSAGINVEYELIDTVGSVLGDTITVPIYYEKDMFTVYNDIKYWMEAFGFDIDFTYNKRALKFLDFESDYREVVLDYKHGEVKLNYKNIDSLKAGKIADLRFLMTVADSISSDINIKAYNFSSEKLYFLDVQSQGSVKRGILNSSESCKLDYLIFTTYTPTLSQNSPNPWTGKTEIKFSLKEKTFVSLKIFDSMGNLKMDVIEESAKFPPGEYSLGINSDELEQGIYFYVLKAGKFTESKKMILGPK
jgi:Concanavalin A-like lectin/glucanases superfamily/Cep192 domain 4/Secretion system C-terminal sorting domain